MFTSGIMIRLYRIQVLSLVMLFLLIGGGLSFSAQLTEQNQTVLSSSTVDTIITEGLQHFKNEQNPIRNCSTRLYQLATYYTQHPSIEFATCVQTSITVKFIDGSYAILLDPFFQHQRVDTINERPAVHESYAGESQKTAVILNPTESMYGHHHCQRLITMLMNLDYSIEYLANQAVDISYMKNNLTASLLYMNTHAGYFDIDGDSQADTVVIATGELWTNETETTYAYEITHQLIVKGMVGDIGFVAITPAFIEQYYTEKPFPGSLVYMATCYALYDTSMADTFLESGAGVYMGWSQNTVFWTNSRTTVRAFRLLSLGLSVSQVCRLIRSGGFYNWLFHSKLIYQGDGTHRII